MCRRAARPPSADRVFGKSVFSFQLRQLFQTDQLQGARQKQRQNSGRRHHPQHRHGMGGLQQPQQFLGDAFRRQALELVLGQGCRAQAFRVDLALAVPGMKAEQPQHPQIILGDAGARIAHEPHLAGDQVLDPGGIVENLAIGRGIKRIDGEIAPRRILGPIVGEGDRGVTAVGLHIAAQGCDFKGMGAGDGGDGAVIQSCFHHLDILALSRASASSGGMGTAMSTSTTGTPSSALRTAPPTKRASPRACITASVSGAVIQPCNAGSIFTIRL
jgi:hypothetical protein